MKIQRIAECQYEKYRFKPVLNPLSEIEKNILVQNDFDRRMFVEMVGEYNRDPNHFGVKMRFIDLHPELRDLQCWMISKTPKLNTPKFEYKFRHRFVWIANGLTDFPLCPVCGKKIGFEDNHNCWSTNSMPWNYKTHCCKLHAEMDPEHQKLVEAGVMASLGVTHPIKDKKLAKRIHRKGRATYRAKTGYNTHFENPEYQFENAERIRRNWNDPEKHREIAAKSKRTKDAKTPEEKADIERRRQNSRAKSVGSPNYHWGTRYYEYSGMTFDSSWEIYAWIWFRDTGHDIRRCDIRFEYEFDGISHGYYPDFMVDGKLIEIKGDQFFSARGDINSPMWYPYFRYKKSKEELARLDGLARAKQKCMKKHNIRILVWKDIKPMKEYVDGKYGKNYVCGFMKKTPNNAV